MANTSKHQDFFVFGEKHFKKDDHPSFLTERVEKFYQQRVQDSWQGRHIIRGRKSSPEDLILQSNDYLCISRHEDVVKAQVACLLDKGQGQMRSAIFNEDINDENSQADFERCLAKFLNVEDVLTAQSGWCANTGLIQSIASAETPVYIDRIAHMSLWEGINSAGAQAVPFRHNDMSSLLRKVKKYGPGVIIVDSVYSTLGDIAPLDELAEIKQQYECALVVDESHSLGLYGENGRGLVNLHGLTKEVDFITSSLSKAFSGRGGIVTCSSRAKEYFVTNSLPAIFSTGVLAHDVAGFKATIDVIKREDWRRRKLHSNAEYLRNGLLDLGYDLAGSTSQIIPLQSGTEENTMRLRDYLEARGIFGSVYCAPATAKNRALVRFSLSSNFSKDNLDYILQVCADAREPVGMWQWQSTRKFNRAKAKEAVLEKVG